VRAAIKHRNGTLEYGLFTLLTNNRGNTGNGRHDGAPKPGGFDV
jgi:hypothetical protein